MQIRANQLRVSDKKHTKTQHLFRGCTYTTHTHPHTHTHPRTPTHARTPTRPHAHTPACARARARARARPGARARTRTHTHTHTHTDTRTQVHSFLRHSWNMLCRATLKWRLASSFLIELCCVVANQNTLRRDSEDNPRMVSQPKRDVHHVKQPLNFRKNQPIVIC